MSLKHLITTQQPDELTMTPPVFSLYEAWHVLPPPLTGWKVVAAAVPAIE